MIQLKHDPQELMSAAKNIEQLKQKYVGALSACMRNSQALQESWAGSGCEAYLAGLRALRERGDCLAEQLGALGANLYEAAGVYESAENKVQRTANALSIDNIFI